MTSTHNYYNINRQHNSMWVFFSLLLHSHNLMITAHACVIETLNVCIIAARILTTMQNIIAKMMMNGQK